MAARQEQRNTERIQLPPHPDYKAMALLPVVGLLSGILTVVLMELRPMPPFAGVVFGGLIGGWLVKAKALRNLGWAWFTAAATATHFASTYVAGVAQMTMHLPPMIRPEIGHPEPLPGALFVGGFFGGAVLLAVLSLIRGETWTKSATLVRPLLGGLCGGVLAALAWPLTPSLGTGLWHLLNASHLTPRISSPEAQLTYGEADFLYSLYAIWQTGMASLTGLMLLRYRRPEPEETAAIPRWFEGQDSNRTKEEAQ